MSRSLWKGAISFGLVSIPVELFSAEERKEFKFSMLDKRDFSPVGYKRYSKNTGKEVEWSEIVKGFEYEKDQYVVLSDEDFKRANVKASRTIDIQTFVDENDISAEYYETPYYLVPGDHGEKVYALLRETLRATGRVGVAQFVMRTAPHLAAIKPIGRALMLFTLRYADELRTTGGFELPPESLKDANVTTKEIDLAKRLIDDMTEKWNPGSFKDTYHEDLMARIREKIKKGDTKEITAPDGDDEPPTASNVIDLAALLKQSIDGKGGRRTTGPSPAKANNKTKPSLRAALNATKPAAKTAPRRKRA